jgi:hypothetical protein
MRGLGALNGGWFPSFSAAAVVVPSKKEPNQSFLSSEKFIRMFILESLIGGTL